MNKDDTFMWFDKSETGKIAVNVFNHINDEVIKVFKI